MTLDHFEAVKVKTCNRIPNQPLNTKSENKPPLTEQNFTSIVIRQISAIVIIPVEIHVSCKNVISFLLPICFEKGPLSSTPKSTCVLTLSKTHSG